MTQYEVPSWSKDDEKAYRELCEDDLWIPIATDFPPPPTAPLIHNDHARNDDLPIKNTQKTPLSKSTYPRSPSSTKMELFKLMRERASTSLQKKWAKQQYSRGSKIPWRWLSLVEKDMPVMLQQTAAYQELNPQTAQLEQMVAYFVFAVADKLHSIYTGELDPRVIFPDFRYPSNQLLGEFFSFRSKIHTETKATSDVLETLYEGSGLYGQSASLRTNSIFFDLIEQANNVKTDEWKAWQEDLLRQQEERTRRAQAEEEEKRRVEAEKTAQAAAKQELERRCIPAIDKAYVGTIETLLREDLLVSDPEILRRLLSRAKNKDDRCHDQHMREQTGMVIQRLQTALDLAEAVGAFAH